MKNLHLISSLPDDIKLLIVNWHIVDRYDPDRRVGTVQYKDGIFNIWDEYEGVWEKGSAITRYDMEKYLGRRIPLSYFKEDMIYKGE